MLNGINFNEKEEDQHKDFLFIWKSYPIPQCISSSKNIVSNSKKKKEKMSLLTLNNIYLSCIKGTLAFPTNISMNLEVNNFIIVQLMHIYILLKIKTI